LRRVLVGLGRSSECLSPRRAALLRGQLELGVAQSEERFGPESRRIVPGHGLEHSSRIGVALRREVHRAERVRGRIELREGWISPHQIFQARDGRFVVRSDRGVRTAGGIAADGTLRLRELLIGPANQQLAQLKECVGAQIACGIPAEERLQLRDGLVANGVRRRAGHGDQPRVPLLRGGD
jgi:hypothetical protein